MAAMVALALLCNLGATQRGAPHLGSTLAIGGRNFFSFFELFFLPPFSFFFFTLSSFLTLSNSPSRNGACVALFGVTLRWSDHRKQARSEAGHSAGHPLCCRRFFNFNAHTAPSSSRGRLALFAARALAAQGAGASQPSYSRPRNTPGERGGQDNDWPAGSQRGDDWHGAKRGCRASEAVAVAEKG